MLSNGGNQNHQTSSNNSLVQFQPARLFTGALRTLVYICFPLYICFSFVCMLSFVCTNAILSAEQEQKSRNGPMPLFKGGRDCVLGCELWTMRLNWGIVFASKLTLNCENWMLFANMVDENEGDALLFFKLFVVQILGY